MKMFSRIFLLFAAVIFTASPVMACCLTGHANFATSSTPSDLENCHDTMDHSGMVDQSESTNSTGTSYQCEGCADCDATFVQENAFQSISFDSSQHLFKTFPIYAANIRLNIPKRTIFTTGPPKSSPIHASTPFVLKQRLLI